MDSYRIPFNRPCFEGNEQAYNAQAVANGHTSGDGAFTRKCHSILEEELGVSRACGGGYGLTTATILRIGRGSIRCGSLLYHRTVCEQSYHLLYLILPLQEQRQALIAHLKAQGILGIFHYLPLHLSKMGRQLGGKQGDCPVTEDVSDRLLRLPFYNNLTSRNQQQVIEAVLRFRW